MKKEKELRRTRLICEVSPRFHKDVKRHAYELDMSMKVYIITALIYYIQNKDRDEPNSIHHNHVT